VKWKISLTLILIILSVIPASYASATALLPWMGVTLTSWVSHTAQVTVTATPDMEALQPPANFALTDLGGITASANWTPGSHSTYTMIRISRFDYPTTPDQGELAYYGDNVSCAIPGIYFDGLVIYATAFSFDSDNITYSSNYTTASIGGGNVQEIADQLADWVTLFSDLSSELPIIFLLLGVITLAFWQKKGFLNIVVGLATFLTALTWINTYFVLSICFMAIGLYFWAITIFALFKTQEGGE